MNRRKWLTAALLAVPVAVGGLAYASNTQKARAFTCPVTGEELPCEKCCPLNGKATTSTEPKAEGPTASASEGDYVCPLTGETLGCPNCCPLNKSKAK